MFQRNSKMFLATDRGGKRINRSIPPETGSRVPEESCAAFLEMLAHSFLRRPRHPLTPGPVCR
jgi:hypothetical protein